MFGLSGTELFLILLFGFLIFGPDKLPQIAKVVGQGIAKFRDAQQEMNKVVKEEVFDPAAADPIKNPLKDMDKTSKAKVEKKESFSARKAKYDRERAEKKKRDAANAAAKEVRDEANAAAAAAGTTVAKAAPDMHKDIMAARKAANEAAAEEVAAARSAENALADEIFGTAAPKPEPAALAAADEPAEAAEASNERKDA